MAEDDDAETPLPADPRLADLPPLCPYYWGPSAR
jgi:hypothetical protein